jgi:hypothetical protein
MIFAKVGRNPLTGIMHGAMKAHGADAGLKDYDHEGSS